MDGMRMLDLYRRKRGMLNPPGSPPGGPDIAGIPQAPGGAPGFGDPFADIGATQEALQGGSPGEVFNISELGGALGEEMDPRKKMRPYLGM